MGTCQENCQAGIQILAEIHAPCPAFKNRNSLFPLRHKRLLLGYPFCLLSTTFSFHFPFKFSLLFVSHPPPQTACIQSCKIPVMPEAFRNCCYLVLKKNTLNWAVIAPVSLFFLICIFQHTFSPFLRPLVLRSTVRCLTASPYRCSGSISPLFSPCWYWWSSNVPGILPFWWPGGGGLHQFPPVPALSLFLYLLRCWGVAPLHPAAVIPAFLPRGIPPPSSPFPPCDAVCASKVGLSGGLSVQSNYSTAAPYTVSAATSSAWAFSAAALFF